MKEDSMLMCLICFVLGFLVARMMRGNGLIENISKDDCTNTDEICGYLNKISEACLLPTVSGDPLLCPKNRKLCTKAFNLYMDNC